MESIPAYELRQLTYDELSLVMPLIEHEGWSGNLALIQEYYTYTPEGFQAAVTKQGEVISFCAAVILDESNAMIAYYITRIDFRGKGIGSKVFQATFDKLKLDIKNVGLHSVAGKESMYRRAGFIISSFKTTKYIMETSPMVKVAAPKGVEIQMAKEVSLEMIGSYDKNISGMERDKQVIIMLDKSVASYVAVGDDGKLCGYGCLRPASGCFRLTPLYANNLSIARSLISALISALPGGAKVMVLMPGGNTNAVELFTELGLYDESVPYTTTCMFTKKEVSFPSQCIYSLASIEISVI